MTAYTKIRFGYNDGDERTVMIILGDGKSEDASVTLRGDDLDMVTAAFFHLRGYRVQPGISHYGLRKYKNGFTITVEDCRLHYKKRVVGPLSYSLSVDDRRPDDLRLWIQSTRNTHMWFNLEMNKKTADEFGRRLSEAAGWE